MSFAESPTGEFVSERLHPTIGAVLSGIDAKHPVWHRVSNDWGDAPRKLQRVTISEFASAAE